MEGLTTGIEVLGLKEAVKYLAQVEPGFKKAYVANMKMVAEPITNAMKSNYDDMRFPSGTKRKWSPEGRQVFPLTAAAAQKGVALRVNNKKGKNAAISVMQKNAAAVVFDIAGRANKGNKLDLAFNAKFGRRASRVIWPAYEMNIAGVIGNVQKVADDVMAEVNKNFKVI
jgi:hypothetical protein